MKTPVRTIRLSDEQWNSFRTNLGMDWLRRQIDRATAKAAREKATTK